MYRVPNMKVMRPIVRGTVESHRKPMQAANIKVEVTLIGVRM